ncbi:hypothetical protein ACVWYF_000375 [Hymenobacter sp. UYAg731]
MKLSVTLSTCCLTTILSLVGLLTNAQRLTVIGAALSPARNARAASRTAPVMVPFSHVINPATAGTIKIFSSQYGGQRTAVASVNGSTVTLAPTAPAGQSAAFRPGETVMVTVPATVQSAANGAGAVPFVYQFTGAATGGSGIFGLGSEVSVVSGIALTEDVKIGDLDGDGDLDFVSTNFYGSAINVRFNNGNGSFSGTGSVPAGANVSNVALGDVDSDGDLDLLIPNSRLGTVSVRLNDGVGNFSGNTEVGVGSCVSVVLGDLDGDGDLDLLTSGGTLLTGFTYISIRFNNGNGTFAGTTSTGLVAGSVALGDLDGDGDLDLIAANGTNTGVNVRLNDGDGTFSPLMPIGVPSNGNIAVGDLDADGDLDFVISKGLGGTAVGVYFNDGSGRFVVAPDVPVGTTPIVALGDVDGDGDLDIIAADGQGVSTSVRLNDGSGSFAMAPNVPAASNSTGIALGDVDNDGDLDLLTTNYGSSTVSIRLNQIGLATSSGHPSANLALYPNPVNATASVRILLPVSLGTHAASAVVLNSLGQTVAAATLVVEAGQAAGNLSTAGLTPGIYTVRLQAGGAVVSKRFTVL